MKREICLRCGGAMGWVGQETLQKGKASWLFGNLDHLLSGALTIDLYCCSSCRRLEFYAVELPGDAGSGIAQVPCPSCGQSHDLDDPKCPHCGKRLLE